MLPSVQPHTHVTTESPNYSNFDPVINYKKTMLPSGVPALPTLTVIS